MGSDDSRHDAASASVVRLHDVSLMRRGTTVLDQVSLTIRGGERWIVLGPNGSGKTTVCQIATTYETPTRGEVHVLGERIGAVDVRDLRPRIGYASAPLERLQSQRMTALQTVATGQHAVLRSWREPYQAADWERADALLHQMGAASLRDRMLQTLSEGERRRVQIARSLMATPELMVLDEPTAGLDLAGREQLLDRLSGLAAAPDGPRAILFVTHHVEEIPPAFTHIAFMKGGRLSASGRLQTMLTAGALSETFAHPLRLEQRDGRYFAWGGPTLHSGA